MKNRTLSDLHETLCDRLSEVADAVNGLFLAADEVAALAEADPALSEYLKAVTSLMNVTIPTAPPSPTA